MSGQGAVRLTQWERQQLADRVLGGAEPSPLMVHAVEAIVAARVASALDEAREGVHAELIRRNLAAFQHEIDTPMRGHDENGACCRAALTALAAPVPPADETEPQAGASGDGGGLG